MQIKKTSPRPLVLERTLVNRLFMVLCLLIVGCSSVEDLPTTQSKVTVVDTLSPKNDLVQWRGISDGEEEARGNGKLAFYFYTADWCAPCITMKRETFSRSEVASYIHANFVPIEVLDLVREEGRNSDDVNRVQMRFLVSAFPTLVVARPDRGHAVVDSGLLSTEAIMRFLQNSPEKLLELEGSND